MSQSSNNRPRRDFAAQYIATYIESEIIKRPEISEETARTEAERNVPYISRDQLTKCNSQGIPFACETLMKQLKTFLEQQKITNMKSAINEYLGKFTTVDELSTQDFYFIATEHFVKSKHDIYPAEIALAKFNLKQGVQATLHMIINPGELPIGQGFPAKIHSDNIHKFPIPTTNEKADDYSKTFDAIVGFVNNNPAPILLVNNLDAGKEQLEATEQTLKTIGFTSDGNVKVKLVDVAYMLYRLQYKLSKAAKDPIDFKADSREVKSVLEAKETLTAYFTKNENYDIGCDFHRAKDRNRHCCLTIAKLLSFAFAKFCVKSPSMMIEGTHYPLGQPPPATTSTKQQNLDYWKSSK